MACLAILWFVMFGDPTRLPTQWLAVIPAGPLTKAPAFLACMALLYFIEGAKAAQREAKPVSPVRRALDHYVAYWKVCAPLVLIGGLYFCEISESPIYCPMFRNLGFLNVSRAILALSNNIHEGTWLISSIAICAFCAALFPIVRKKWGTIPALTTLLAGIAVQAVLYLKVMPFMYNGGVYRPAALIGPAVYMLGFLLFQSGGKEGQTATLAEGQGNGGMLMTLSRPLRFIGRRWTTFWMAQFYVAMYYYHVAASVYAATGNAFASYALFLVMTGLLLYALEWGYRRLVNAVRRSWLSVPSMLLMLAVPFLLRLALEVSMDAYAQFDYLAAQQWPIRAMVNVSAIFSLILIFRALMGRWLPAGLTVTVLMTLLAIANHYTMKYHGALLTVEDIHNVGTVTGVISSYDLSVDAIAGRILLLEAAAAACCVLSWLCARPLRGLYTSRQRWVNRIACLLSAVICLYFSYFSAVPIIERQDNIWSWGSLYAKIGYLSGTVESTMANLEFSVYRPRDYSGERIAQIAEAAASRPEEAAASPDGERYPDIVMILNETWYDLDQYIDTGADVDYLKNYRALDNAIKGFAEVPLTGGGTNGTEYEMLTGNSMTLINAYAPFNRLNFTDTVTLPRYLKQLGYATIGAHPHESQNYHRGMSWSQMGIDQSYFIHDFTDLEYYADRNRDHEITDTTALKNLIRFMDDMPEDGPRFAFLATMQNHGDWTTNRPDQAVVHSHPDTQDQAMVDKINEYLSCLTYTDAMIDYMQQYYTRLYEETGRRVVVCMVGDHSPSFLPALEGLCKWQDRALAERKGKMTPYFIWANYPLDLEDAALSGVGDMDLCCLMPAMLRAAGVPLSYYYRYILDMNRDVAVYTNVGSESAEESRRIAFYDREGQLHYADEDLPSARMVSDYFCMEYNLNGEDAQLEPALFVPEGKQTEAPAGETPDMSGGSSD